MRGIQGGPAYRSNPGPLSTFHDPYAADPSILKFGDGTRADVGEGPLGGVPTFGQAIYGIKRLGASGDASLSSAFPTPAFTQSAGPSSIFGDPTQATAPLQPDVTPQMDDRPERSLARRTYDPSQGSPFAKPPVAAQPSPDGSLSLNDAYLEYLRRLNAN